MIVAKDKSKKSKSTKPAGDDDFARPSDAPAGGDGWTLTSDENRGALLLITPLREIDVDDKFSKEPGATKKVIVADVVVIDEKRPERSEEHEEVYVFSGYLKGALRGFIGERRVLGRLRNTEDTTEKKDRGNYYWELEDASKKDVEKATEYMAAANDPLRSTKDKGGKKSKAEPAADAKPSKDKGKKKSKK